MKVTWGAHVGSWRISEFRDLSRNLANSRDDQRNALITEISNVTLIPFTHTIYTLITHKTIRKLLRIKPYRGLYNTHHFRDNYSSLSENSFIIFSPLLSHYYTLRGDLYSSTAHTYSKCKKWFGVWKVWGPIDPIGTIRVGKGWAYGSIPSPRIRAYLRTISKRRSESCIIGRGKEYLWRT